MTRTDRRRLLQRLAFSESRHFSWDIFPPIPWPMTISSLPPSLFPLGRNGTTDRVSKAIADAGPTPSWYCPAVSPHSAGLVCPVFLYGAKTVPPTRAERQQKPASRRRRHVVGSGPNYRRLRCRLSRRNPPRVHPARGIFK